MDTNKNTYTVIYTIVMVAIVATILALVSMGLKDKQQTNIKVEKQMNILGCAGLAKDAKTVSDRNSYVQDEFKNILSDKDERDKFLKQVIKDWHNHKITKNNSLSVY